jgi:PPM family protein phosphatase
MSMKIQIKQPVALHDSGSRAFNEDFIFPLHNQANPEERLFVVCDGEGGPNVGEVAAKLVALSFAKYFASSPPRSGEVDQAYLDGALHTAEEALKAYKDAHPDNKGMATTVALLHLGDQQVTMAWVGNSQLYHYDQKQQKLISPSQETGNPQALITGSDKPQSMQVRTLPVSQLHRGDYFLLTTDGISDQVDRSTLEHLFKADESGDPKSILAEIKKLSESFTEDNYSCYLLQVEQLPQAQGGGAAASQGAEQQAASGEAQSDQSPQPQSSPNNLGRNLGIATIVIVLLALITIAAWPGEPNRYGEFIAQADEKMEAGDLRSAIALYDSALSYADNKQEVKQASDKLQLAQQRRNEMTASRDVSLPESAEQYILNGEGFFEARNYTSAIEEWEKAQQKLKQMGQSDTLLPKVEMAQAYINAGDEEFNRQNYPQATLFYQAATDLMDDPALANFDAKAKARTQERLQTAQANMASEPDALAENQSNARSMAPAESPEEGIFTQATDQGSSSSTSDAESTPKANARVAPARSAMDGNQLSKAQRIELEKKLSTGKRFFTEAKEENSAYLYRSSVEKLEAAGPMLDGSGAYLLAYMYHSGLGVEKDEQKALRYAQLSARKGWPSGQYYYGFLLLLRQNPRDTVTAIQSLQEASANNYFEAVKLLKVLR